MYHKQSAFSFVEQEFLPLLTQETYVLQSKSDILESTGPAYTPQELMRFYDDLIYKIDQMHYISASIELPVKVAHAIVPFSPLLKLAKGEVVASGPIADDLAQKLIAYVHEKAPRHEFNMHRFILHSQSRYSLYKFIVHELQRFFRVSSVQIWESYGTHMRYAATSQSDLVLDALAKSLKINPIEGLIMPIFSEGIAIDDIMRDTELSAIQLQQVFGAHTRAWNLEYIDIEVMRDTLCEQLQDMVQRKEFSFLTPTVLEKIVPHIYARSINWDLRFHQNPREVYGSRDIIQGMADLFSPRIRRNRKIREFAASAVNIIRYNYFYQIPLGENGQTNYVIDFLDKKRFSEEERSDMYMLSDNLFLHIQRREYEYMQYLSPNPQAEIIVHLDQNFKQIKGFSAISFNAAWLDTLGKVTQGQQTFTTMLEDTQSQLYGNLTELVRTHVRQDFEIKIGEHYFAVVTDLIFQKVFIELQDLTQDRWRTERDDLTGLYKPKVIIDKLEERLRTIDLVDKRSIAILFFDMNFLKRTNELLGYLAGSNLIKAFVLFLRENFRAEDVIGRYGGDEFLVICDGVATQVQLQVIIDKLLAKAVAKGNVGLTQTHSQPLQFALGATLHKGAVADDDVTLVRARLFVEADSAMYEAKGKSHALLGQPCAVIFDSEKTKIHNPDEKQDEAMIKTLNELR